MPASRAKFRGLRMNRRGFLSLSLLAPVAGVMAARNAMAAPAVSRATAYAQLGPFISGEAFIGERVGESPLTPHVVRKIGVEVETFGVDNVAPEIPARPAEDESVSAQFEPDLAFLRDEPGVTI